MPGPYERAGHGRRDLGAVELQRRCRSHRDALARIPSPPDTEILLKPLGYEPETQSLKRCFQRDLNLPFLDLQFDHVHPDRALA